ncbi:hypothetical protein [Streptomyces sp. NPDC002640]
MVNWTEMRDCFGDVDRVPVLLERVEVEAEDDAEAWDELEYRLVLEHDLVFPAGFAALPRLVCLAPRSARARGLAGAVLRCAPRHHRCGDLLEEHAEVIAEFRTVLDRHLRSRPEDYLATFRDALAAREEYHWSAVLGDFTDDSTTCPAPTAPWR